MADIIAVPNGNNSADNSNKSSVKTPTDAQKFRELMQVKESGEKQKKKKKQSAEEDAEKKADQAAAQGVNRKKSEPTPTRLHLPKAPKIEKVGESEKRQQQHGKRSEEVDPTLPEEKIDEVAASQKLNLTEKMEGALPPAPVSNTPPPPLSPQGAPEVETPQLETEPIPVSEEKEAESEDNSPPSAFVASKPAQEKKKDITPLPSPVLALPEAPPPSFLSSPQAAVAGYSLLNPEVLALFEKLASVILVMQNSGKMEMTVQLNSQEFPSFKGASIVIEAYKSAPGEFNITLQGSPQGVAIFNANLDKLQTAFDKGKYSFRIRRLETRLDDEISRVERKKPVADEQEGES